MIRLDSFLLFSKMRLTKVCAVALALLVSACYKADEGNGLFLHPGDGSSLLTGAIADIGARRDRGSIGDAESVVVDLAPGDYVFTNTVVLTNALRGGRSGSIVFRAKEPGSVRFVGGTRIPVRQFAAVRDASVLRRLRPEVRQFVLCADIATVLRPPLAPWGDALRTPPAPWLYVNGKPYEIARWPNRGHDDWMRFSRSVRTGVENKERKVAGAFCWEGDSSRPQKWDYASGVWLYGYWTHDWSEEILRADSFEVKCTNRVMALKGVHCYGIGAGTWGAKERRFFALNIPEELDDSGEFWVDRERGRLYVVPTKDFTESEIILAHLDRPFIVAERGKRVSRIRFENIDFCCSHATQPAVSLAGDDNSFVNCRFYNLGGGGLELDGERNRVENCRFWNLGAFGVSVRGGDQKTLSAAANLVEDCDIGEYGRFRRTYAPAIQVEGVGQVVRGCRMHDAPHNAVLYGGNDHLFESNEIWNVLLETGDAGAFYTGRRTDALGTIIRNNHFHDIGRPDKTRNMTMAVYFDDCDWGDAVYSNRFERCGFGVFIGGGNLHPVVGNEFTDCACGVHVDSRGITWKPRGIFLPDKDRPDVSWYLKWLLPHDYRHGAWGIRYPELHALLSDRPEYPRVNPITDNVFRRCERVFSFDKDACAVTNEMPVARNVVIP